MGSTNLTKPGSSSSSSSSTLVPTYREEITLRGSLKKKLARDLAPGDVLYPRGAIVQGAKAVEGVVGAVGVVAGEWGVPAGLAEGEKVKMVKVVLRHKGTGAEKDFVQEVGEAFEYLLWKTKTWGTPDE